MIRAQDQDIQSLVADIRDGKLLLPEMQRSYVWKSTQVRDLFDSLYHEYPSGQLLVWETDDLPASVNRRVSVEGLVAEQRRPQLLLDGQQRLTSLAAVMLDRPLQVRDISRPIDIAFNVFTEKFEVVGPRQRALTGWISLAKLFTEGAMAVYRQLKLDPNAPETDFVYERLSQLDNIKRYRYRVNVLEYLSYAEVTRIFVRTNSGGTKLGYADLALAQVSSSWQGVTEELERYRKHVEKQGVGLVLDNGLLLRAIVVILTKQSRFIRFFRGDKQEVTVDELKDAWERAKKALDQSISFLVHNCMIDRLEMLTTRSVLMPLVAFFDHYGTNISDIQFRELQRWVYMALIWSRYSGSSETAIDQDISALNTRIDAMERQLRQIVEIRLRESRGESAWKYLVPNDIRLYVDDRIKKHEANKPFETGQHETLAAKLAFCQFSDYFKIIRVKTNWPLFQDVFGKENIFDQNASFAIEARNAIKHGRDLSRVDLASAEAGLLWLEECLNRVKAEEQENEVLAEAI